MAYMRSSWLTAKIVFSAVMSSLSCQPVSGRVSGPQRQSRCSSKYAVAAPPRPVRNVSSVMRKMIKEIRIHTRRVSRHVSPASAYCATANARNTRITRRSQNWMMENSRASIMMMRARGSSRWINVSRSR